MEQSGEDEEGIKGFLPNDILKELRRGARLKCHYCEKKYGEFYYSFEIFTIHNPKLSYSTYYFFDKFQQLLVAIINPAKRHFI